MQTITNHIPHHKIYRNIDHKLATTLRQTGLVYRVLWEPANGPSRSMDGTELEKTDTCAALIQRMEDIPPILTGNDEACYSWRYDRIYMPDPKEFAIREEYYLSLFHELIHSTGHPDRLNRKQLNLSGDSAWQYKLQEELTAEIGALYLCGIAGIEEKILRNSAAYIKRWMESVKCSPDTLPKAKSAARTAVEYLFIPREDTGHASEPEPREPPTYDNW